MADNEKPQKGMERTQAHSCRMACVPGNFFFFFPSLLFFFFTLLAPSPELCGKRQLSKEGDS